MAGQNLPDVDQAKISLPPRRNEIKPGTRVQIVEKQNQPTGKLTEGIVARLLTSSPTHPHGIKVMLTDGKVGRVQKIIE
jgi:uncharacterized repeat protein (TIGR03833 family)